jgi:hypothetical protein
MKPKVRFLREEEIESAVLDLLAGYGSKYGAVLAPPVPVEEILEAHLDLSFELGDLPALLGIPDVLGATWVRQRKVKIDQSLDPTLDSSKEGRYRFTVSHEVGHWELHRHHYLVTEQDSLFVADKAAEPIVCRSGARDQMEWQANSFAGHLLMPKKMVVAAWEAMHGTREPYVAAEEIADLNARWGLGQDDCPTVQVSREMSRAFKVSGQAMQIRLIGLGLIRTKVPEKDLFSS